MAPGWRASPIKATTRWIRGSQVNKLALFIAAVLRDLTRDRATLVAENAFLRAQLQIFKAQIPRPKLDDYDRALLVFLSSVVRRWKSLLVVVEPRTLLSWANDGFRGFWAKISRAGRSAPEEGSSLLRRSS